MTDTVIAHHDYEAQQDDELSFITGDTIKVTDHSNADWWLGSKQDGSSGYFPSNFVEALKQDKEKPTEITTPTTGDKDTTTSTASTPVVPSTEDNAATASTNDTETSPVAGTDEPPKQRSSIGMARVMEDYAMQQDDELTLHKGGIVVLYERSDDGEWLEGEINGKQGRFPAKHVEDIDMPGRPDLGMNNTEMTTGGSGDSGAKAPPPGGFKLAAFGVKQGGIGSLLAGGIPTLKKTSTVKSPTTTEPQPQAPSTPSPPAPSPPAAAPAAPAPAPAAAATQQPEKETSMPSLGKAIVLHPYDAENDDELNLIRGEYIDILDRHADEGWWQGRNEKNQTGVFPNNFVKEIEHDQHTGTPPPPVRTRKSVASVGAAVTSTTSPMAPPPESRPFSTPTSSLVQQQQQRQPVSQRLPPLPDTTRPPVTTPNDEDTTTTNQVKQEDTDAMDVKDTPAENATPSDISSPSPPAAQEEEASASSPSPRVDPSPPLPATTMDSIDQQQPQQEEAVPLPKEPVETKPVVVEQQQQQQPIDTVDQTESRTSIITTTTSAEEHTSDETNKDEHTPEEPKDTSAPTVEEMPERKEEEIKESVTIAPVEPVEEPKSTNEDDTTTAATDVDAAAAEQEPKVSEPEQPPQEEEETKKGIDFGMPLPTSGPRLVTPNRTSRPSNRAGARRPPTKPTTDDVSPSQTELLQQELEKTPEEEKPAPTTSSPTSPPPKPIKPIFAKFPTPFAGGPEGISAKNLKPVQRRMFEPSPAHEPSPPPPSSSSPNDDNDANPRPTTTGGVRGLASRFAGIPNTGGGNEVMETKLRNFTKNEVEKTRKEFEGLLEVERARIATLESMVESLMRQVDQMKNGDSS